MHTDHALEMEKDVLKIITYLNKLMLVLILMSILEELQVLDITTLLNSWSFDYYNDANQLKLLTKQTVVIHLK